MADYGLAAQIGRGGGAGGMPQQQDPQNRMMQMMQLQQLQQNMMLAREQEARQAQLFGPQLEGKRLENVTEGLRQNVLTNQGRETGAKADVAVRANTAESGVLDYIQNTPPEERTKPERLDALRKTNSGAYMALMNQINAANAIKEKARTEEFSAQRAQFEMRRVALAGMSSLLPAITDQSKYDTLYQDYRMVDPMGAKLIGPDYTPQNVAALRARVQELGDIDVKRDEQGNDILINKRDGSVRLLSPAVRPAPPSASTFGNLEQPLAQPPVSTQMTGPAAAALPGPNAMLPPGAAPIIQPRAGAPEGLGPKAVAAGQEAFARETAQTQVKQTQEEEKLAKQLDTAIAEISKVAAPGGLISKSTGSGVGRAVDAAAAYFFGVATSGALAGAQLAPIADLALKMVPRFEGPQSDADRKAYESAAGQIADTSVPTEMRQAAAKEVVRLMQKRRNQFTVKGEGAAPSSPARAVTRTGTLNGRRVVEYSDGKVEYAD